MLKCVFRIGGVKHGSDMASSLYGFEISGHAGYGTEGNDIVCAAVSSCTMLVCNAITENFKADADVIVEENRITLTLKDHSDAAVQLMTAFYRHLEALSEDYDNIKLSLNA
ncbi:MAG: ribosomal-processing cysteine protease Prp [Oscillospiraceae bacterium]|nr:ribosomal-processing cysteine protease Prp [Oscillospiraceae bacterium]